MKKRFSNYLLLLTFLYSLPAWAQWSSTKLSQARSDLAATSIGNKVFFAGGRIGSISMILYDRVDIIDISAKKLSTATLSQARSQLAATSLGSKAFFAGGTITSTGLGPYSDRVDIYDDATGLWTTATLSQPRRSIAAISIGTKVFFAGGFLTYNDPSGVSDVIDIYDTATGIWSTATLSAARGGIVATSVGTKAFFAGGAQQDINGNSFISKIVDIYDTATGLWTTSSLSQPLGIGAAISVGTKAFFAGEVSNKVDIYDDATGLWTMASLSQKRCCLTATHLGTKAFFAGGEGSSVSDVVDIYDETTGQWSISKLSQARTGLASTSTSDYAFFGGGGLPFNAYSDVIDIYSEGPPLGPLPVNLIAFTGKWLEKTGAQLNWATSLETNNDYFQIQRSSDAKSFETIGRVQGKGSTNERTDYRFTDADMPDQLNYYRLKQVDLDGSFHFSNIIAVNRNETSPPAQLSVWPSPTTATLTMKVSAGSTISQIDIYDLHGRRLSSQVGAQATADVSGLPTGAYVVDVLTTTGQHVRSRFVKQ